MFHQGLRELLTEIVSSGTFGTAAQACVMQGGRTVVEVAVGVDGVGAAVDLDSVFSIYCACKPLTAVAIGSLFDSHALSPHDRLGDVLAVEINGPLRELLIEDLLRHTAGLEFQSELFLARKPYERDLLVRSLEPLARSEGVGRYSEYASWHLLALVLEALTELRFDQAIDQLVLAPLHLSQEISFTPSGGIRDRLRLNVDLTRPGVGPLPILWEASPEVMDDIRPGTGAVASMRGLATLFMHLASVWTGSSAGSVISGPTTRFLTQPATALEYDPVLGRTLSYSRGFFAGGAFPGLSRSAFGCAGLSGMTFAAADPERDVALAIHTNGIVDGRLAPELDRRELLVRAAIAGLT